VALCGAARLSTCLSMGATAAARSRFTAATTAVSAGSPLIALFWRAAGHESSLSEIDLADGAGRDEFVRWPTERQAAALALLEGSRPLVKLNLSGLNLTDALAPTLAVLLSASASGLSILNLERNDLREEGLLLLIDALAANAT
jgi:hypothetical protein